MTEDPFKFACFYYSKRRLKADIWIYSLPCYELKRNKIKERIEKIKNLYVYGRDKFFNF